MMYLYRVLLFAATALAVCICPVLGETPGADFMSAALRHQGDITVEAIYSRSTIYDDGSKSLTDWAGVHYVRTPGVLSLVEDHKSGSIERVSHSYDLSSHDYRALCAHRDGSQHGTVDNQLAGAFIRQDMVDAAHYPLFVNPASGSRLLCDWIAESGVVRGNEVVGGRDCVRVNIDAPLDGIRSFLVWLDRSYGYSPARIEIKWKGGSIERVDFKDYRIVGDGLWFPGQQTIRLWDEKGKSDFQVINTVKSVTAGPDPGKDKLIVQFSKGTPVLVGRCTVPVAWP